MTDTATTEAPQSNPGEVAGWPKLVVTYTTDPANIAPLLPPGIQPLEPTVTVGFFGAHRDCHLVFVCGQCFPAFNTVFRSLSPRPLKLTSRIASLGISGARRIASATACDDSSAGMMPSYWHKV